MQRDPWSEWLQLAARLREYCQRNHGFDPRRIIFEGETETARLPIPSEYLVSLITREEEPPAGEPPPREHLFDTGERPVPTHSLDFRVIRWGAQRWALTPKQSLVVKALWEGWERGEPDITQADLLAAADSECVRLVDLFRASSAWQSLVFSAGRGVYRLCFVEMGSRESSEGANAQEDPEGVAE